MSQENLNEQEWLEQQNNKSKEEHFLNLIQIIKEVEESIKPYKEHLKDTKRNYKENGWLTPEEIKIAGKVKSLIDGEIDLDQLVEIWHTIQGSTR